MKRASLKIPHPLTNFFLDSGAYSAMMQKTEVEIDDYIDFIIRHKSRITVYANLDVIGSAEGTLANQLYMEEAGLDPMPVFHGGEDLKWLKYYIDRYDYLAIGGAAGRLTGSSLIRYLDKVWGEMLTNDIGEPVVKVHGFGITSIVMLLRYPWYSVDSTSWLKAAAFGNIMVPRVIDGEFNYQKKPLVVTVSNKSKARFQEGRHLKSFPNTARIKIREYFEQEGFTETEVSETYRARCKLNIRFYQRFSAARDQPTFQLQKRTFFE